MLFNANVKLNSLEHRLRSSQKCMKTQTNCIFNALHFFFCSQWMVLFFLSSQWETEKANELPKRINGISIIDDYFGFNGSTAQCTDTPDSSNECRQRHTARVRQRRSGKKLIRNQYNRVERRKKEIRRIDSYCDVERHVVLQSTTASRKKNYLNLYKYSWCV